VDWLRWKDERSSSDWESMRGGWFQANAARVDSAMQERSESFGRLLLVQALGAAAYALELRSEKLMSSPPGQGLQNEHCDAATLQEALACYTVILYLTAGDSTALPSRPYDKEAQRIVWQLSADAAAKNIAKLQIETHAVLPGCALVLSHAVLHHGPRNKTVADRITLFQQWVPVRRADTPDADYQRVPLGL
jgi:hypothetical protein